MIQFKLFIGAVVVSCLLSFTGCNSDSVAVSPDKQTHNGMYYVMEWLVSEGDAWEEPLWSEWDKGIQIGEGEAVLSRPLSIPNVTPNLVMELNVTVDGNVKMFAVLEGIERAANIDSDTLPLDMDTLTQLDDTTSDSIATVSPARVFCPRVSAADTLLWQKIIPVQFTRFGFAHVVVTADLEAPEYWLSLYKEGAGEILIERLIY